MSLRVKDRGGRDGVGGPVPRYRGGLWRVAIGVGEKRERECDL